MALLCLLTLALTLLPRAFLMLEKKAAAEFLTHRSVSGYGGLIQPALQVCLR